MYCLVWHDTQIGEYVLFSMADTQICDNVLFSMADT